MIPPRQTRLTPKQAQRLTERSLRTLAPVSGRICCVLAQPELESPALHQIGFACVETGARFIEDVAAIMRGLIQVDVLLVASVGRDGLMPQRILSAANTTPESEPIVQIVAVMMPILDCESVFLDEGGEGDLEGEEDAPFPPPADDLISELVGASLAQARFAISEAGADETICLFAGEALRPHRVVEIVHSHQILRQKVIQLVEEEIGQAERKYNAKLASAQHDFIMGLPGHALEYIPAEEESEPEVRNSLGQVTGIRKCTFGKWLGAGSFGSVFQAQHEEFGTTAVKVISKRRSMASVRQLMAVNQEMCLLLNMEPHPNVVRAFELVSSKGSLYCVMEYAGQHNLHRFIEAAVSRTVVKTLPEPLVLDFSRQQAAAISHLHSSLVVHRDLKPENWIVDDAGQALRLADFGLATQLCSPAHLLRGSCGSLPYVAPEVYGNTGRGPSEGYSGFAADIWGLGVGYMEFVLGHRSISRLLQPPGAGVVKNLAGLAEHWGRAGPGEPDRLCRVIGNMLVVAPQERWPALRVLGSLGHDLMKFVRPPTVRRRATGGLPSSSASPGPTDRKVTRESTISAPMPSAPT